jgi:integrase
MPKATSKLTKRDLDKLRAKVEAEADHAALVADAGQPGLYVWARRGRVQFVFVYRSPHGGARKRLPIDWYGAITLDRAREIAQEHRGKVAGGIDPQEARDQERREAVTVADAVKGYLEDLHQRAEAGAKRGKRSGYAAAKRLLERHVLPRLGSVRARDLTSDQVKKLHRSLKATPGEANRMLTALSAVYGWADRSEQVPAGTNPARNVERLKEDGERRAFTAEELRALGEALREAERTGKVTIERTIQGKPRRVAVSIHPSAVLAVRVLALTGFRRAELLGHTMKDRRNGREGLRWGDVDLDRALVALRDTKAGKQTRVLGQAAVALLRAARPEPFAPSDCVCPGLKPGAPFIGIDKARAALWKAAGLAGVDLHSLRHTYASVGAHVQNGRYVGLVAPMLGHAYQRAAAITERYISSDVGALRVAADAVAAELARLLGLGEPAKVLTFPAGDGR